MFNLVNVLSDKDKNLITEYIRKYGAASHFIGVDEWLKDWGKEKIKLYKLFNNSFTYSVPIEYIKPESEIRKQITDLLDHMVFKKILKDFIENKILFDRNLIKDCCDKGHGWGHYSETQRDLEYFLGDITSPETLRKGVICFSLKLKPEGCKQTLQIPKGTKTIKAINKFLTYFKYYFKDDEDYKKVLSDFETFRLAHSMILNDKVIKGELVLSIHPLDFITMSDNASNWISCMNWTEPGCYHVGTVEMMNSNNVICCYLTSKNDWEFSKNEKTGEVYLWNNKRWRQLAYVTPEILMTGKSYPYQNEDISRKILDTLKELSIKNLNQDYEYGIEPYNDMQYINTVAAMDRARYYRGLPKSARHKKNIIFDTHGMYNDMLNDHVTKYLCYRNKVKKTTIISVSGKTKCLCCGKPSIVPDYDWINYGYQNLSYNDRYQRCGEVICMDCVDKYFTCEICYSHHNTSRKPMYCFTDEITGAKKRICEDCIKKYFKECPICNKPMNVSLLASPKIKSGICYDKNMEGDIYPIIFPVKDNLNPEEHITKDRKEMFPSFWRTYSKLDTKSGYEKAMVDFNYVNVFGHKQCICKKLGIKLQDFKFRPSYYFRSNTDFIYTKILPYVEDPLTVYKDFLFCNLKDVDLDENSVFEKC